MQEVGIGNIHDRVGVDIKLGQLFWDEPRSDIIHQVLKQKQTVGISKDAVSVCVSCLPSAQTHGAGERPSTGGRAPPHSIYATRTIPPP